jgi:hypothetical protein
MSNYSEIAKFLAPRQKRLQYWKLAFDKKSLVDSREISSALNTYSLLLSKYSKLASASTTGVEQKDVETRIHALDREITALFEQRRLITAGLSKLDGAATVLFKPHDIVETENH